MQNSHLSDAYNTQKMWNFIQNPTYDYWALMWTKTPIINKFNLKKLKTNQECRQVNQVQYNNNLKNENFQTQFYSRQHVTTLKRWEFEKSAENKGYPDKKNAKFPPLKDI